VQFGYLNNQRLEQAAIMALADLPSLDVLRATFVGPVERAGNETGRFAQHARDATRARDQGESRRKAETIFRPLWPAAGQTNKQQKVNRRFTTNLKKPWRVAPKQGEGGPRQTTRR